MKKVAIVIPFYKSTLTTYELIALQQCTQVLSGHSIIAVKPEGLTLPADVGGINFSGIISFDNSYFKDLAGYNRLMLSAEFYGKFLDYEYILIYQMDTFVFRDELLDWCNRGYDYIGAPWIRKTYHKSLIGLAWFNAVEAYRRKFNIASRHIFDKMVGNGGFSLRRVEKFQEICISMRPAIDFYLSQNSNIYNEDIFWSVEVNRQRPTLNIPNWQTALTFAFEVPPQKAKYYNPKNLPFGCHDWDKYADFWRPIFKLYGYDI
jgi:hypothetical protein